MVLFKYINKKDNTLIGYHLSTFCQVGDKDEAKQYSCKTVDEIKDQQTIIQKNFNTVINSTKENDKSKIIPLNGIRESYFNGLTQDDVELQHEII